ncbi:hypothetical protein PHYPSEUDO_003142 [Phytophthora pseudosyringae]|uniref:WRKY19-like zinc finger domain-containing protein n=1 Tax=Phytophthora pseudosyringae TaxID=221518 RepID=A0A8T1VVH2_9STRA|nr:hypothetical protein PHYPSEUDO_003142 [Phytophthora pseudosyringae]
MCSKSKVSFLLNPQPVTDDQRVQLRSPMFVVSATPSYLFVQNSCIAPLKKTSGCSVKSVMPVLSLCGVICTSSNGEEPEQQTAAAKQDQTYKTKTTTLEPETRKPNAGRTRVRKHHTPPCQVEGCKNIAVSRGCCVRHGGGSRCTVSGCSNRAKLYKKCFQHGGFNTCATEGCTRKAKRYGFCWSHGGGRICKILGCKKVSTQNDLCWAHGGGNRCKLEGCSRRSYQKYGYYCVDHASPNLRVNRAMVLLG